MHSIALSACTAMLAGSAALAAQAGTVEVSYDPAAAYADAGESPREREANLAALADTLKALGARLPGADTVLRVQLIDVDLAGTVRPVGAGQPLRILRGSADWPQIRLRYTLFEGGSERRRGEESLADMNYSWRNPGYGASPSEPLRHEKRLLSDWFEARFGPASAPAQ